MIHLSSYHSNGLPTVVWPNKVNLIGEKVYKPKIHFCEHCNKPILIYGRLIPCKHVFCFTCATLCLTQQQTNPTTSVTSGAVPTPPPLGPTEPPSNFIQSPHNNNSDNNCGKVNSGNNERHNQHGHPRHSNHSNKNLEPQRNDSNNSFCHRESSIIITDDSLANTTPTTMQLDANSSPNLVNGLNLPGNGLQHGNQPAPVKGCHRCGGRALRVERNTLNSIFVCQIETCKRTYLSARDLQAHVTHRHSRNKANNSNEAGNSSASLVAISSSPYISSSTLMHLNSHNNNQTNNHRQSSSSTSTVNNVGHSNNSPNNHQHRRDRESHHHRGGSRARDRERERDRDRFKRDRDSFQRERERERDSKEYHRQSLQRAAQWAEASAQMLEKGLTR